MGDLRPADQVIFGLLNATLLFVFAFWAVGFDRQFGDGFAAEDGPIGNLLSVVLLGYLVVLPLLYPRVRFIAALADRFMVPVGSLRHAVGAVAGGIIMMLVDLPRQWEVFELVFALLTLSIFLAPVNAERLGFGVRRPAQPGPA
jgi:hypothetical protein